MFNQSFVHSIIHSFHHSFIHSIIYSFIPSFIHSLINYSIVHLFSQSFVHSIIHSFIHSIIRSFIPSVIHLLTRYLRHRGFKHHPIWADLQLDRHRGFWVRGLDFPRVCAHQTKTRRQTETQNQRIREQLSHASQTHPPGVRRPRPAPAPLPSPALLGWGGSGVLRGRRGMMISSTFTPSSACFSDTWERSSDWLGEKRLQHLHMKMAGLSARKSAHVAHLPHPRETPKAAPLSHRHHPPLPPPAPPRLPISESGTWAQRRPWAAKEPRLIKSPRFTQVAFHAAHSPTGGQHRAREKCLFPVTGEQVPVRNASLGPESVAGSMVTETHQTVSYTKKGSYCKGGLCSPPVRFTAAIRRRQQGAGERECRKGTLPTHPQQTAFLEKMQTKHQHQKHRALIHSRAGMIHVLAVPSGGRPGHYTLRSLEKHTLLCV